MVSDSNRCNPVMEFEVLLGDERERDLVGALSPPLFGDSIWISFIHVCTLIRFYSGRFP